MNHKEYEYAFILEKDYAKSDLSQLTERLKEYNFSVYLTTDQSKQDILFLKYENYENILREAEILGITKEPVGRMSQSIVALAKNYKYLAFIDSRKRIDPKIVEHELYEKFSLKNRSKFFKASDENNYEEYLSIFNDAEKMRIIHSILGKLLLIKSKENDQDKDKNIGLINHFSKNIHLIEEISALHNSSKPLKSSNDEMRKYFGENNTIYFYFLEFLQKWLHIPFFLGIIVKILNIYTGENVQHSPYDAIYSIALMFWASLYLAFWARKERALGIEWHSYKGLGNSEKVVFY